MSRGLDGWATNALQSAAAESSRTARIVVWWSTGLGYVLDTLFGELWWSRPFALQFSCKTGRTPLEPSYT